jgi:hypothetical protein
MANNNQTLLDPLTGKFDDWFELYNADTNVVDLTDYTLTDDLSAPAKFVIPPGTLVPAQGFLLVWADGGGGTTPTPGELHVGFRLAKAGSVIGLFGPDGSPVDAVAFGLQTADVSEGRSPDGAPVPFQIMPTPTPGAPNLAPAPRLIGASVAPNGEVIVGWSAQAGKSYRVQFTDDLSVGNWLDLATNVVATGGTAVIHDSLGAQRLRFYRVIKTN